MALVFRGRRFLSVPEVADELGVTRLTVHRWLRGTRGVPDGVAFAEVISDTRTRQSYIPETVVRRCRDALRRGDSVARRKKRPADRPSRR